MFQDAIGVAANYTLPVIISRKTVGGSCSSSIGAFVVVNEEGWIVTAGHILKGWVELQSEVKKTRDAQQYHASIKADQNMSNREKSRKFASGPKFNKNDSERCSAWWGIDKVHVTDITYFDSVGPNLGDLVDIGVGRLEPFNRALIKQFPVFKDPTKAFEPGRSLCKLGFPFHSITPMWDESIQGFRLPDGALPIPRFPIDGIFTRLVSVDTTALGLPYPCIYVETSSAGLRGQSGGPTFDNKGVVWAIQAKTVHLPLGFNSSASNQFLHVGYGVHPTTIFGLFNRVGIKYQVSPD